MNKRIKRQAIKHAEKIARALKSSGVVNPNASIEIRVQGHKHKLNKRQSKPR